MCQFSTSVLLVAILKIVFQNSCPRRGTGRCSLSAPHHHTCSHTHTPILSIFFKFPSPLFAASSQSSPPMSKPCSENGKQRTAVPRPKNPRGVLPATAVEHRPPPPLLLRSCPKPRTKRRKKKRRRKREAAPMAAGGGSSPRGRVKQAEAPPPTLPPPLPQAAEAAAAAAVGRREEEAAAAAEEAARGARRPGRQRRRRRRPC